jgi:ATP-dependent helicase HrpA
VIDTGFARISRYSHRSKVQRLPVERVSQASADQRKGRCGRVAAGICIRLYSEEDFEDRREFMEPEILRTNLASVILQMKLLGFGDIEAFPFVDAPDSRLVKDGYRVLEEIGAVDASRKVTRLGRQLSRLPVDPRIGRMLLEAAHTHCLDEVLVIAAALSIQDPRDRPMEKRQAADEAHVAFRDEESDFISHLKLWRHLQEQRRHLSKRKFRNWCRDHFLSWNRVQEWYDIHHQLRGQMHEMGYKENRAEAGYQEIHKAVLSGLLSHIGFKERDYLGARNSRFHIFPGSALFKKQPKWVVAAELVETTKLYARGVAMVRPEWIESLAGHLLKRSYSEPHWEKKRGQVAAYERVTLFGIVLVPKRKVNFGPIKPAEAREIFIRFALVEGDFHSRAPFWRHNRELMEQVLELEHKSRRQDLLVDEQTLFEYYDKRIPEGIYSTPQFEKWLRKATQEKPKLLHMRREDLVQREAEISAEAFPDHMDLNGMQLPLEYHFSPGHKTDGVSLRVPRAVLNQVTEERCQWLVPGLLRERIIALIKSLPKPLRKSFVPVPDYADACLKALEPSDRPLTLALAEQLKAMTGVHIPEDAWQEGAVPEHLRMNIRVQDERGKVIAAGRDLSVLRKQHGGEGEQSYHQLPMADMERDGILKWDFGELPESVEMDRGGIQLRGFPALLDRGDSVALRVLDSKQNAERNMRGGLRRLFMLNLAKEVRYLRRNLPELQKMRLQYAKAASTPEGWERPAASDLEQELVALVFDLTFIQDQPAVRNARQFEQRIAERKGELMSTAQEVLKQVGAVLEQYQQLRKALSAHNQINWMASLSDMKQQLDRLVYMGFLQHTPYAQLEHLPRYLAAIGKRLEKLGHAASRDQQLMNEMGTLYQSWQQREQKYRLAGRQDERIEELRWTFEELRVSLFAQELKTAYPASLKRLEKRWRELGL